MNKNIQVTQSKKGEKYEKFKFNLPLRSQFLIKHSNYKFDSTDINNKFSFLVCEIICIMPAGNKYNIKIPTCWEKVSGY